MTIIPYFYYGNNKFIKYLIKFRSIFDSIFYYGNSLTCPICGGHFRKFLSYRKRPNVLCPKCYSFERHRLIWLYLNNGTNILTENIKVLHIAPEYIFQKLFKSMTNIDYIATDLSSSLADVKSDITGMSFKDNSFDAILCVHVLEHIIKDKEAMRELYRILKHGGWAILQSPVEPKLEKTFEDANIKSPEDRERIFGYSQHVRIYGKDYKQRLENAGFIVNVDSSIRDSNISNITKYGLLERESDIYFCTKK